MLSLEAHFEARRAEILSLICSLVSRETTSHEAARLDEIADFVAAEFTSIGAEIRLIRQPGYGTHLRASFFASLFAPATSQLLILGHLDTVWPVGTIERLPYRVMPDGTATGPGIFDMKAGVAIVIEALRAIKELGREPSRPVTVLLTCDEEIGSRTSRILIEEEARKSVAALVLEPPIPGGIVKTARKGVGVYRIRAIGRAAHAGLDPAKGINAIVEMAHQTLSLAALNNFELGTTVSTGMIHGGTASNVVPAQATAEVDVRFWEPEEGQRIDAAIKSLTPVLAGSELEISGGINRPPMPRSPQNQALFELASELAHELGFELQEGSVGGGSDGNFTAALGVPTLDGLGVDGAGAHAEHEHIILADLPRRAALLTRLIESI